tara:strand:+ start:204 stop:1013 length:810 start_codon:yes stop_codon:yes gene_type:complete
MDSLSKPLVEHILSFVSKDTPCTSTSRAELTKTVLTVCSTNEDRNECAKYVLDKHTKECRQCTIRFSNFAFEFDFDEEDDAREVRYKFAIQVLVPTPKHTAQHQMYVQLCQDFCQHLHRQIRTKAADKREHAFSVEEYEATDARGREQGHGRLEEIPFRVKQNVVEYECLLYTTRNKSEWSAFSEGKKQVMRARAQKSKQAIEESYGPEHICQLGADFFKQRMCPALFKDCSHTIDVERTKDWSHTIDVERTNTSKKFLVRIYGFSLVR